MATETETKTTNWERTKAYKELYAALKDDLESRGAVGSQYEDLVKTYMTLWVIRNELQEDIRKRGVVITYQNGTKQQGVTNNKSVEKLVRVSTQMLQIWTTLGYKDQVKNGCVADPDEDDEL